MSAFMRNVDIVVHHPTPYECRNRGIVIHHGMDSVKTIDDEINEIECILDENNRERGRLLRLRAELIKKRARKTWR